MSKQDRQGVRTPTDVERKYDLGQLSAVRGLTAKQEQTLNQMAQTLAQYISETDGDIDDLYDEIETIKANKDIDINEQTPTYTVAATEQELTSGEKISVAFGKIAKSISSFISHLKNKNNPHGVTLSQIGALQSITTPNTNLNDYKTEGIYYFSDSAVAPTNMPSGVANGWLEVIRVPPSGAVRQIWHRLGSASNHYQTFVRNYTGGVWGEWQRFATLRETCYSVGDTFTAPALMVLNGYVTSGGKDMYLFLPLGKVVDVANIKSVKITAFNATIRGINGYVGSTDTNFVSSSYTLKYGVYENGLHISVRSSTAFSNAANNTPVSAQVNSLTLSFA